MNKDTGNQHLSEQEQYWKELHLEGIEKTRVGYDFYSDQYEKKTISFPIKKDVLDKLKSVTKGNDMLEYVIFLAVFNIELYKYTGNDEIVIGVPVYFSDEKRPLSIKNKMLPFKCSINGNVNIKRFLLDIQKKLLDVYENQYIDLVPAFRKLNMPFTLPELTPVSITYNPLHAEGDIEYICNSQKNEITICLEKNQAEEVEMVLVFNSALYEEVTVIHFAERFIHALNEMLGNLDRSVRDVGLLTETQMNHILYEFNNTNIEYKEINKPIHELFEFQAEKTPDQTALIYEDNKVTYKELNDKSNAFARTLRSRGIQSEDIVGIMLERSIEMVAGILGILKSGAAYMPIDPKNPKDRIEYMLHDAQTKVLVSEKRFISDIKFEGIIIDAGNSETFKGDVSRLEQVNQPNDLAYVIYTSGTTGNPKGVMVEHHSLTQTMLFLKNDYQYSKNNIVLPIINYAFDGFVLLFYTPLIAGSKVVLVNNEEMVNPYKISEIIKTLGVTDYFSVPSIYLTVLDYISLEESISLRQVTLVGEELPVKAIEYTNRLDRNIEIVNRYGPSENTVETTAMRHVERYDKIMIGKPIANTKVYIVDEDHNILPIGIPGEICIGGSRLARGYLNRPELTKEKFINNPFEKGQRMYKTGDRAKWLSDGTIEFLGRKDNQVKIRGQRIELKEIEDCLLRHPDVKEAFVHAEKNSDLDQYIIAYVVRSTASISDIKNYLNESLPHYMVPSYIMQLEKMPLTNNGKTDFRSLPKPNVNDNVNLYAAPRNNIEKELVDLWQEVLGVIKVGIDDNFFDLGGHSLKANVFISKLHKNLDIELPIKELFINPTIRALSDVINRRTEKSYEMIPACQKSDYYEASSAQKRMYMIQQLENRTAYNMPIVFAIKGDIDSKKVEKIFQKLVDRHESLRTSFEDVNGDIVQKIHSDFSFTME
ncbi:amino acid adenylation domain-containing protein, partial [Bacillus sp. ChL18]|uniref:non-ribosomal peptide synthetase n=2 Tax=Bacteria TaxID=2 RepID=UPI002248807A